MGEPEAGEGGSGRGETQPGDQIPAQEPHGRGIKDQGPLAGKADEPRGRVELEEFLDVEILNAHGAPQRRPPTNIKHNGYT